MAEGKRGKFIMIDGIAGSGKSTILRAAKEWAKTKNLKVFDLTEWSKDHKQPPSFSEVADCDIFFTFEPTRTWVGDAIRFELSRDDKPYTGEELAHAFALDRSIMYKRLIIPALENGRHVIQDRGVSTSIVYQPIQPKSISLRRLLKLPGNAAAMKYAPDFMILIDIDVKTAIERIGQRNDDSKGVFQGPAFLKKLAKRFRSRWFSWLFTRHGASVHAFDTRLPLETVVEKFKLLLEQLLK
jgi:dTMP kinase